MNDIFGVGGKGMICRSIQWVFKPNYRNLTIGNLEKNVSIHSMLQQIPSLHIAYINHAQLITQDVMLLYKKNYILWYICVFNNSVFLHRMRMYCIPENASNKPVIFN